MDSKWFNATHKDGWQNLDELRWQWDDDQRKITITHKDGKRIGCTLVDAFIAALSANPHARKE